MPPLRYDACPPLAKLLNEVALLFQTEETNFGLLVTAVFHSSQEPHCTLAGAQLLSNLLANSHNIISAFCQYSDNKHWVMDYEMGTYQKELRTLVQINHGWHFSSLHASAKQI